MSRIEVVIDEIVFTGFGSTMSPGVVDAMRSELERLLSIGDPAAIRALRQVDTLDAGTVKLSPGASADATGQGLGRAVHAVFTNASPNQGRPIGKSS